MSTTDDLESGSGWRPRQPAALARTAARVPCASGVVV